jgi:engulfment/cell motility protein 1
MDQSEIPSLLSRLASDEDAMRKMAVFKLQSTINDPAFADVFISAGGLAVLGRLIVSSSGNTLAYALQSLSRLLEIDMGWQLFEGAGAGELVEHVVALVVTHPLVNILRGAMSILVAVVSHPSAGKHGEGAMPGAFGFRALKPAVAVYPQFLEMVVAQLGSADHALCANALMLVNALIRDAIGGQGDGRSSGTGENWPKFVKRLQDLGVIRAAYALMQSSSLHDLAHPLLDFQSLTKVLLRKWRDLPVDLHVPDHRRALKSVHLASQSAPERMESQAEATAKKHSPEKWRRLGFESESPSWEFEPMGFLGLMDLTDYVKKHETQFQRVLQEQAPRPLHARCPLARASLAVTAIMYEQFDVDRAEVEDARSAVERNKHDRIFKPLLLQWSRLHTAGIQAMLRLWSATRASLDDFDRVAELVRVLYERVVGQATRTQGIEAVEAQLAAYGSVELRALQAELLELSLLDRCGPHLQRVRDELRHDALQFIKEQRIRCLLAGAWFLRPTAAMATPRPPTTAPTPNERPWRYAKLSSSRRFLHSADFAALATPEPGLEQLGHRIDLGAVSSVVSNVSAAVGDSAASSCAGSSKATTRITINTTDGGGGDDDAPERAVLNLYPQSHGAASEWLDGLLMLLDQAPITAETNRLVALAADWGLRVRLLNVRDEGGAGFSGDLDGDAGFSGGDNLDDGRPGVVPTRDGLDEDYYYAIEA